MQEGLTGEAQPASQRLFSLDALRGLIMVLMALDHANAFVAHKHSSGEHWGGPFPMYDDALAFLTRLVTHPAAPGFSFLMGVGMVLFASSRRKRGWSEGAIRRHFLLRGAFLIVLQLTIVNLAWRLGGPFPTIYIGVLIALGGGMILGGFLTHLAPAALAALAAALFVGLELTHPAPEQWGQIFDRPLGLLLLYSGGDNDLWSNYPILPWLETMVFGLLFGQWLVRDSKRTFRRALGLGAVFLMGFVVLRALDGFGNIRPRAGDGWIDFLNVVKYPPAMTFTLLTMGVNLLLLWLLSRVRSQGERFFQPLVDFGRVPLFFYVLHLYLYLLLGRLLAPDGSSLPAMYPVWLLGLLILWPLCRWYGRFKGRQPAGSLLRFL